MRAVRIGPVAGLVWLVVLLLGLGLVGAGGIAAGGIGADSIGPDGSGGRSGGGGLGGAGWAFGLGYGLVLCGLLSRGMIRAGAASLGPADRVTLTRAILIGGVTALVADSFGGRAAPLPILLALIVVALVLDAVDGQVARRTATASPLGARFDMEVDAILLLVLSGYVARDFGVWVVAIGGMRYGYVAASWVRPWLRQALPPRYWRKVVAAIQGVVLAVAVADVLPRWVTIAGLVASLALLVESFGRDIRWQRRAWARQRRERVTRGATGADRGPAGAEASAATAAPRA